MKIGVILDQIDLGAMALPEFQRGYVWNRDQVRGLMDSLYRKHPVGSLLVWVTKTESANARGDATLTPGSVKLLLDGQQRITSLYGIIRGKPPKFFDGNVQAFSGLYFNLEDETFEFYAPLKMRGNPLWIDVTALMRSDVVEFLQRLLAVPELAAKLNVYITRVTGIIGIRDIDLHIEEVTGEDKTVDVVVDIFNRVNSGGTKLSKGDLALARICAGWPEARDELKARLQKWHTAGFDFRLEWLLRNITTVLTGEAMFSALKDVDTPTFRNGIERAERRVDTLLNLISSRLGLDHDLVLGSRYSFPVLARYLDLRNGQLGDAREQDKLLYWYINSFLWGRYAGSTESALNQDLELVEQADGGLDRLIEQLRRGRGDLRLAANDFIGWSQGARFFPLLYMLTRVSRSRDWDSGLELSRYLLGHLSRLELHHIFPKALLYKHGYFRSEVNALANLTFLTQATNLKVSDRSPSDYLPPFVQKQPGAVESHWIPMDPELWEVENFREFLTVRRELLAKAANEFLDGLYSGASPTIAVASPAMERAPRLIPGSIDSPEEKRELVEFNEWVVAQGLPRGELAYQVVDPVSGDLLAVFDLAWPDGLQEGYSQAVTLLLDEPTETEEVANQTRFRYFTDVESFREYVRREILALEPVGVA